MRTPNINVKIDDLEEVMKSYGLSLPPSRFKEFCKSLSSRACNWRTVQMKDKQVQRLVNTKTADQVALEITTQARHKKIPITKLTKSSPNWWVIEKIAQIAEDMSEMSDKPVFNSIKEIVTHCLKHGMQWKQLPNQAMALYEALVTEKQLEDYEHKEAVFALQAAYIDAARRLNNLTLVEAGKERIHFLKMVQDIVEYNADPGEWLQAQFDAFAVWNNIPKPSTLYGEGAYERYISYKSKKC